MKKIRGFLIGIIVCIVLIFVAIAFANSLLGLDLEAADLVREVILYTKEIFWLVIDILKGEAGIS